MKKRVFAVILLIVAAAVVGSMTRSATPGAGDAPDAQQNKEIRESYKLQPGAEVLVVGINGKVEIETSETDTAEVFIERNARNAEDLSRRQITVEHTDNSLTVRGERKSSAGFWSFLTGHGNVTEHVLLKLPRKISLEAKGVNGHVYVGEVDGNVRINGVNGKVEIAQTSGYADINGVNGALTIAVKQLGERGLRINGVNGRVELRLHNGLNADLQARGMNGGVNSDMPDVSVQKDGNRNYSARIGNGGAPISLNGINGGVKLTRDAV